MDKRIALLRGINVGGKRKIRMTDLTALFESLGFTNIVSYIQSGNIIFNTPKKISHTEVSNQLAKAIFHKFGFEVPVIVLSANDLEQAFARNPFYKENESDLTNLHLTFLKEVPSNENLQVLQSYNYEPDKFKILDKNVFLFCTGKYHLSKLSNTFFEKKLKVPATTRNWKTVIKLMELSQ